MIQAEHPSISLLDRLAEALHSQQTGTFFVATHDNSSCRFSLDNGKITHLAYKRLHGLEALKEFATILSGRWSFSEGVSCPFRPHDSVEHYQAVELLGVKPVLPSIEPIAETISEIPPPPAEEPVVEKKSLKSRLNMFYRGGFSAATLETETLPPEPTPAEPMPAVTGVKNRFYRGGYSL